MSSNSIDRIIGSVDGAGLVQLRAVGMGVLSENLPSSASALATRKDSRY